MDNILRIIVDYWYFVLAVFVYYFIIMPYWLVYFRQKLFEARTDWFCFAADGNIEFSNELYQELREMINVFIRVQKYYTIITFIMSLLLARHEANKIQVSLNKKISACNEQQQEAIFKLLLKFVRISIYTLLVSSPILSAIIVSFFGVVLLFSLFFKMQKKIWHWIKTTYQEKTLTVILQGGLAID